MRTVAAHLFPILVVCALAFPASAAPRKAHLVALGVVRRVHYSKAGDPAGAQAGDQELRIRALMVDGVLKEWTTGDAHDVTDRSFVIRRALKLNDALPGDAVAAKPTTAQEHWVWQRGPWLLVDRVTGHFSAIKLPDYDPALSQVSWFRDYAAYCGVTASGKSLYAIVAQIAARKPVLARKLSALDAEARTEAACELPEWQREPLAVGFHPVGKQSVSFQIAAGSALLVEDAADESDQPAEKK